MALLLASVKKIYTLYTAAACKCQCQCQPAPSFTRSRRGPAPCPFSTSDKITKFSVLRRLSQSHGSPNTTGTTTTTNTTTTPWVLIRSGRTRPDARRPAAAQTGPFGCSRRQLDRASFPRADDGSGTLHPRTADYYFLGSLGMGWKPGGGLLYQVSCLDNEPAAFIGDGTYANTSARASLPVRASHISLNSVELNRVAMLFL